MKKEITFKLFFTVLWRGICHAIESIAKIFGYKGKSTYAKVVWRILVGCFTLIVAATTIMYLYSFATEFIYNTLIRPTTEEKYYESKQISNEIVFQKEYGGTTGRVYDNARKRVVLDEIDWVIISEGKDSLAPFSQHGKRGYLNRFTGEVVISPRSFTKAWVFSDGLAAVEKDNELVFIDYSGNVVIDKDFRVHFSHPSYVFKNGYCVIQDVVTEKYGLIDKRGEWILNPEYGYIFNSYGFWHVEKDGRYGLYDSELNEMFPTTNTAIEIDDSEKAIEVRCTDNTAQRYDYDGNLLVDFVIDDIENMQYETTELRNDCAYSEEYYDNKVYAVAKCLRYRVNAGCYYNDHYGLMDRDGNRITEPLYTRINAIGEDLYLCQPGGIIINGQGEIIK